jgi:hypothetical protein
MKRPPTEVARLAEYRLAAAWIALEPGYTVYMNETDDGVRLK